MNADVFTQAYASIKMRGWHDSAFGLAHDAILMAEVIGLGEEIGEYMHALRTNQVEQARLELADCMISLVSVAVRLGVPHSDIERQRAPATVPMIVAYGNLCRTLRRPTPDTIASAVHSLADAIWTTASQPRSAVDLASAMKEKLFHDELRGHRHGGV